MAEDNKARKLVANNKKAYHDYFIEEKYEAGLELFGTEVKSIRQGKFSFADSYAKIVNSELWLIGFTIQPYDKGSVFNHKSDRNRRLLVHKQEIKRLRRKVEEKGLTLVPTKIYFKGNLVKVQVSLCRGKALHDKKDSIKARDIDRQAKREAKEYRF